MKAFIEASGRECHRAWCPPTGQEVAHLARNTKSSSEKSVFLPSMAYASPKLPPEQLCQGYQGPCPAPRAWFSVRSTRRETVGGGVKSCSSKKAPPRPYCSSCRLISLGDKWLDPRTKSANFLGSWSLETASHVGKPGWRQAWRRSSRPRAVSTSACSLYSSSVRCLAAGHCRVNHCFTLLLR